LMRVVYSVVAFNVVFQSALDVWFDG
jgi:hypothetical protein